MNLSQCVIWRWQSAAKGQKRLNEAIDAESASHPKAIKSLHRGNGTFGPTTDMRTCRLSRATIAIHFERSHEMPGAIEQTYLVRRIFMYHGYTRVLEALWNNLAFGQ